MKTMKTKETRKWLCGLPKLNVAQRVAGSVFLFFFGSGLLAGWAETPFDYNGAAVFWMLSVVPFMVVFWEASPTADRTSVDWIPDPNGSLRNDSDFGD